MPKCKISRYFRGIRTDHEFLIPTRVTITGKENHFHRATEDAALLMEGMERADELLIGAESEVGTEVERPRLWVHSVTLD